MDSTLLKQYAEVERAAQVRLRELDEERQHILGLFPSLNGAFLPDTSEIGQVLRQTAPEVKAQRLAALERITIPLPGTRKPMSQRQKKMISRRMKAYWRERRKLG